MGQRQLDAALDLILAQALRARARAIELQDSLSGPDYTPAAKGRASAMATLVELDVNELVRQAEKLQAERSKVAEADPLKHKVGVVTPNGVRIYDSLEDAMKDRLQSQHDAKPAANDTEEGKPDAE